MDAESSQQPKLCQMVGNPSSSVEQSSALLHISTVVLKEQLVCNEQRHTELAIHKPAERVHRRPLGSFISG